MADEVQTLSFTRRHLPHWLVAGRPYFVTLCRKGCLPVRVLDELRAERAERVTRMRPSGTSGRTSLTQAEYVRRYEPDERSACAQISQAEASLATQRQRFLAVEAILDAAQRSERDLCVPDVSSVVLGNLDWLRGRGWRVWAATVMPSHLHLVVANMDGKGEMLRKDLSHYMSYVARAVNTARGSAGGFWQREPFDHWCRDSDAWLRSVSYTVNNPVKAGLCAAWRDWPCTVVDLEVEEVL
jgi:REP element-mobilizing transposase RayT